MKNSILIVAAILLVVTVVYQWRRKANSAHGTIAAQAGSAVDSDATYY